MSLFLELRMQKYNLFPNQQNIFSLFMYFFLQYAGFQHQLM